MLHTVDVVGDLTVGRVIHYRQFHKLEEADSKGRMEVIRYQRAMLFDALKRRPEAVIEEGMWTHEQIAATMNGKLALLPQLVEPSTQIFDPAFWSSLSNHDNQLLDNALYTHTALRVYPFIMKDTTALPTKKIDDDLVKKNTQAFIHLRRLDRLEELIPKAKNGERDLMVAEYRSELGHFLDYDYEVEKRVTNEAMEYLRVHPGATIAVAIGAAHNLCDDFGSQARPPRLESITFPNLIPEDLKADFPLIATQPCRDHIPDGFKIP